MEGEGGGFRARLVVVRPHSSLASDMASSVQGPGFRDV